MRHDFSGSRNEIKDLIAAQFRRKGVNAKRFSVAVEHLVNALPPNLEGDVTLSVEIERPVPGDCSIKVSITAKSITEQEYRRRENARLVAAGEAPMPEPT